MALKPADVDSHNALAAALAGPDASNDWRGRGSGERAEEAMHHFRRGLQLEAGHSKYSRSKYSLRRTAVPQAQRSREATALSLQGGLQPYHSRGCNPMTLEAASL